MTNYENILELNQKINSFSDEELITNFNQKPPIHGEFNYYPVFATRMSKFKDLIFEEAISKRNTIIKYRTFKPSWFIVISVLDYCEDEFICLAIVKHIKKHWGSNDFESFTHYIKSEKRLYKYIEL